MKTALILGITSDIGRELAVRLGADGWRVAGTRRTDGSPLGPESRDWDIVPCDFASLASVDKAVRSFHERGLRWGLVVAAVGTERPVGDFFGCNPDEWERGIRVNALAPLRFLREIHELRDRAGSPAVAFFSGSGTNNAAPAYSAYSASKILLVKMCELLDAESADTSFFIIGPGMVRTKIHQQTLEEPEKSGRNYKKVADFLASGDPGTSHDDIYRCLLWCLAAGKAVIGGRNIALVHDEWRDGGSALASALKGDQDLYRLRRFGNQLKFKTPNK
jgi:NAD(P)-dependent dehydrogenase (short-subunit alcohol dehydrogenase family)